MTFRSSECKLFLNSLLRKQCFSFLIFFFYLLQSISLAVTMGPRRPFNFPSMISNYCWLLAVPVIRISRCLTHNWWKTCHSSSPHIMSEPNLLSCITVLPFFELNKFFCFSFNICHGLDRLWPLPHSNPSPLLEALWQISASYFQLVEYSLLMKTLLDYYNLLPVSANPAVC